MRRKRGPAAVLVVVGIVALLGPGCFVPISILTLLTGLVAAWMGPGFGEPWVLLGIAGFAATFLTGILVLKPRAEKLAASTTGGQVPQGVLLGQADTLMTIARVDYVTLFLVVGVMALKPEATDVFALSAMAVAVAVGASDHREGFAQRGLRLRRASGTQVVACGRSGPGRFRRPALRTGTSPKRRPRRRLRLRAGPIEQLDTEETPERLSSVVRTEHHRASHEFKVFCRFVRKEFLRPGALVGTSAAGCCGWNEWRVSSAPQETRRRSAPDRLCGVTRPPSGTPLRCGARRRRGRPGPYPAVARRRNFPGSITENFPQIADTGTLLDQVEERLVHRRPAEPAHGGEVRLGDGHLAARARLGDGQAQQPAADACDDVVRHQARDHAQRILECLASALMGQLGVIEERRRPEISRLCALRA